MNDNLLISLVQPDIIWEKPGDNLAMLSDMFSRIKQETDLIILPEMFTTGFTMRAREHAEKTGGQTMKWMADQAEKLSCVVTGSIIIDEGDNLYNRLIWMKPDRSFSSYDKRHLFRMAGEHLNYSQGNEKLITDLKGWRICPLICYDLRFPVWSRNRFYSSHWDYDVLIYIANWPAARNDVWTSLLSARAIENQSYSIGVNRAGTDGNDIIYSGSSMIVSLTGNVISLNSKGEQEFKTLELDGVDLENERNRLQAGRDWDQFDIHV